MRCLDEFMMVTDRMRKCHAISHPEALRHVFPGRWAIPSKHSSANRLLARLRGLGHFRGFGPLKINELIKKVFTTAGAGARAAEWSLGRDLGIADHENLPKEHVSGNQTHSASLGNRVGLHYSRFRLFARANSVNNQWFTDSIRVQNRHFQTQIREDGLNRVQFETRSTNLQGRPGGEI